MKRFESMSREESSGNDTIEDPEYLYDSEQN